MSTNCQRPSSSSVALDSEVNLLCAMALTLCCKENLSLVPAQEAEDIPPPLPPIVDCTLHLLLEPGYHFLDNATLHICRSSGQGVASNVIEYHLPLPSRLLYASCALPDGNWLFTGGGFGKAVHLFGRVHAADANTFPSSSSSSSLTARFCSQRDFEWKASFMLNDDDGRTITKFTEPLPKRCAESNDDDDEYDPRSAMPLEPVLVPDSDFVLIPDRGLNVIYVVNWRTFEFLRALSVDDPTSISIMPSLNATAVKDKDDERPTRHLEVFVGSNDCVRRLVCRCDSDSNDGPVAVDDAEVLIDFSSSSRRSDDDNDDDDDFNRSYSSASPTADCVVAAVEEGRLLVVRDSTVYILGLSSPSTSSCYESTPKGKVLRVFDTLPKLTKDISTSPNWMQKVAEAAAHDDGIMADQETFCIKSISLERNTPEEWIVIAATNMGLVRLWIPKSVTPGDGRDVRHSVVYETKDYRYGTDGVGKLWI